MALDARGATIKLAFSVLKVKVFFTQVKAMLLQICL